MMSGPVASHAVGGTRGTGLPPVFATRVAHPVGPGAALRRKGNGSAALRRESNGSAAVRRESNGSAAVRREAKETTALG